MSDKVNALASIHTGYSEKIEAVFAYRAAFIETGYNFLSDPQSASKGRSFVSSLKSEFKKQAIPVSSKELQGLALEVLDKIADQWKLPKVEHSLANKQLFGR